MTRPFFAAIACAVAALAGGCGPSPPEIVPVEGVVTLDGKPLPDVEIRCLPMIQGFGGDYTAVGITDENGHFVLEVLGRPGACAVSSRVTVDEAPLPDEARGMSAKAQVLATKILAGRKNRPLPTRYANFAQSPLTLEIAPGQTTYTLTLTR